MTTDGIHIIKKQLKNLPDSPGVYRMLSGDGQVLYVGKAKNIIKRVTQYTQPERMSSRIRRMVFETRKLMVVETATEVEALLLEANLIKNLQPKYNIVLKDDATFPGIWLTEDDELPTRLLVKRGKPPKTGDYFGPYPVASAAYEAAELIEKIFKLRTCSDGFYKGRSRPCLKYNIKRCSAPCVGRISRRAYHKDVEQAKLFLMGKTQTVQDNVRSQMLEAAADENFELAATHRDRLQQLSRIAEQQSAIVQGMDDADVVALYQSGGQVCVQVFFYRQGAHVGNVRQFMSAEENTPAELMYSFLSLYYSSRKPPRYFYLSHMPAEKQTLTAALSQQAGRKVHLELPKRGEKQGIVSQAVDNAKTALQRKMFEHGSHKKLLAELAEKLHRDKPIERIECFDVSNTQGRQAVASMVVAGTEGMEKGAYRKFAIKGKNTPDDYAMMFEVLERRYKRMKNDDTPKPDVVMVDGGVGHLHVLEKVFEKLDLIDSDITLTAIAKGPERDKGLEKIYLSGHNEPVEIPPGTPLIFLLQRIRDEAHRFAIGYHRQKRSKKLTQSVLDDIPGVGPGRKKALLLHFGSAKAVRSASLEELKKVNGLSHSLAQTIYQYFR